MNRITHIRPADGDFRATQNRPLESALIHDYNQLGSQLARRGIGIARITEAVQRLSVALPSWATGTGTGTGTGGTRLAGFAVGGEPATVYDRIEDCAVVHALTGAAPGISLHFPCDEVEDIPALRARTEHLGMHFDAVASNSFLSHTDPAVRAQAVEHDVDCVRRGEALGARALTIWIGDDARLPGQSSRYHAFERHIDSARAIAASLPPDWTLYLEHKMVEPAFRATANQDWGSSLLAAQAVGAQARCLVDLGHHAPDVNIEMIVSRLIHSGKLGGFYFNDSKYGDDLDAGAIDPYRLFLVFNELVEAEQEKRLDRAPVYKIGQSHNVVDPIESLISSTIEIQRAYAQALLVDRRALAGFQEARDEMMANQCFKRAFVTDVSPILAMARMHKGAAIDPLTAYRASGYRAACAESRAKRRGGGGIV